MRKLVLVGLLAGAALVPAAPASAQCIVIEGVDGCVSPCPAAAYRDADRATGGALPKLPGPLDVNCTL